MAGTDRFHVYVIRNRLTVKTDEIFKRRNITKLKHFDTACVCMCVLESKGWGKSRATENTRLQSLYFIGEVCGEKNEMTETLCLKWSCVR